MQLSDFSPVRVLTSEQSALLLQAEGAYQALASRILDEVAPSAHRTASLRLLLESKMTLIHGITHA